MESIESKFSSDGSYSSDVAQQARLREQVDQRLSCPVCLERFSDPRLLDCTHTYCRKCLINVLTKRPRGLDEEEDPSSGKKLYCPKCRKITYLDDGGIDALPINYALKDIVEVMPDDTGFSPSTPVLPFRPFPDSVPFCEEHKRHMEFYCETDSQLVCADCLTMPRHRGHDTVAAKQILERELDSLRQNSFENAERMLLKVREAVDNVSRMTDSVKDKGEVTKSRIQEHFREIRDALEAREQSLLNTTEDIVMKKVSKLERQQELLAKSREDLEMKVVKLKHILANKHDYSFLKTKQRLVTSITETVELAMSKERAPIESALDGPDCFLPADLLASALTFGGVYCLPYPPQFTAQGEGLSKGFLNKVAKFKVEARDRYGQRSVVSGTSIKVVVQGPDHSITPVHIEETARGEYLVTYTPTRIGYHLIRVTADGVKIQKSDSHAVVFNKKDYFALSLPQKHIPKTRLRCDPPVARMRSVCSLPSGNIVFTDEFCLRIMDPGTCQIVQTIGSYGTGSGQFSSPQGLAVNRLGYIFASDSRTNRIEKFASDGRHLHTIAPKTPGGLSAPEGLAVLGEERLYVADCGNDRIQIFLQKNGKSQGGFGKKGTGAGQFISPKYLAMDTRNNRILVSDTGNFRIQALTLDGKPLLEFGSQKSGSVYLSYPYFINVDEDGFILVTETKSHYVTILTPRGAQVRRLGNQGDSPGQFRTPYGICVNPSKGQIIVTDSTSHCIQIF